MKRELNMRKGGFTLVEALLSMTILALIATVVSAVYASGFQALDMQSDRMLIDSALRSQMEFQLGNAFADLSSGTTSVTVNGQIHTVTIDVVAADLDGDAIPEPTAKQLTVSIDGRSLTAIVVDDEARLGKI